MNKARRLAEKFTSLAEPILGGAKTRDLIGEIGRLETLTDLRARDAAECGLASGTRAHPRRSSGSNNAEEVQTMASIRDPNDTLGPPYRRRSGRGHHDLQPRRREPRQCRKT